MRVRFPSFPLMDNKELQKRVEELENALKSIRDNYDCDSDAHKYGTECRCCLAESLLGPKKW